MNNITTNQCSHITTLPLNSAWTLTSTPPSFIQHPNELSTHSLLWSNAVVPGTAAQALSQPEHVGKLDDSDWWYQCEFIGLDTKPEQEIYLRLDGLASIADVWLNDQLIVQSNNMFIANRLAVTSLLLKDKNHLTICFRSLTKHLEIKRARPRWKTKLVNNQQLRWVRTTLLGRIPGWTPATPSIGPWKQIQLEQISHVELLSSKLNTSAVGNTGTIKGNFTANILSPGSTINSATLHIGNYSIPLTLNASEQCENHIDLHGEDSIPDVKLWWPHTHGDPTLLDCKLVLHSDVGDIDFSLGKRGFKHIQLQQSDTSVGFQINGIDVFCRGACWTVADFTSLTGNKENLKTALTLAKDAGINMLRVGGTMVYESDEFYDLCDQLGIMVWQDFMFANMDYPISDSAFHQSITAEVNGQLDRLSSHASISVYCGNSEVQQQAAMLGLPKDSWSNHFFDNELRELCAEKHTGIPYFPSTPCGGVLPFHLNQGLSHYYGVGAYKRPITDAKLADVQFTPETLGFSHIPEPSTIDRLFNGEIPSMHDPRWKQGIPRDTGAGWDFEDIRDHYLSLRYKEDPVALRSHDPDRYLALSRVVTGEVIYRVFAHWRSSTSQCNGALIWFYKDLVPGAGWGIIDSNNQPKAAYFSVKRAFVSQGVFIEDAGLNGLCLHVINEREAKLNVMLELQAFRDCGTETLHVTKELTLNKQSKLSLKADELVGYFSDLTYAYRFGPIQHQVVVARLIDMDTGNYLDDDCYFPTTHHLTKQKNVDLTVEVVDRGPSGLFLKLFTQQFLQSVRLVLKTHRPEDNYFHLVPNCAREIKLHPTSEQAKSVKGYIEALNLQEPIKVRL